MFHLYSHSPYEQIYIKYSAGEGALPYGPVRYTGDSSHTYAYAPASYVPVSYAPNAYAPVCYAPAPPVSYASTSYAPASPAPVSYAPSPYAPAIEKVKTY